MFVHMYVCVNTCGNQKRWSYRHCEHLIWALGAHLGPLEEHPSELDPFLQSTPTIINNIFIIGIGLLL